MTDSLHDALLKARGNAAWLFGWLARQQAPPYVIARIEGLEQELDKIAEESGFFAGPPSPPLILPSDWRIPDQEEKEVRWEWKRFIELVRSLTSALMLVVIR